MEIKGKEGKLYNFVEYPCKVKARAYTNATKRCNLCITEKFFILSNPQMATLNKRNAIFLKLCACLAYLVDACA